MDDEKLIQEVRASILRLAAKRNLDSAVIAAACADVLADIAATSDRLYGEQKLNDRLDAFCKRVAQAYGRLKTLRG